jgi:hypothetical protein
MFHPYLDALLQPRVSELKPIRVEVLLERRPRFAAFLKVVEVPDGVDNFVLSLDELDAEASGNMERYMAMHLGFH